MKLTMKFDTDTEEEKFKDAFYGSQYKEVIKDTLQFLRNKLKYTDLTDEQFTVYTEIKEEIIKQLEEHNVYIYE